MNKTPRLGKSGIEYLDYVWNFYSGCYNRKNGVCHVEKCWAKGITERFPGHYPNGFDPTFYPEAFLSPLHLKKPSIIGCAFMGDLFGDWVDPGQKIHADLPSGKVSLTTSLKGWIFTTIRQCPQHRFLFLTKCPQNLIKWGEFPDNCWVGVTVTSNASLSGALERLRFIDAKVKYISFEPLLREITGYDGCDLAYLLEDSGIDQVIIGSQTKPYKPPRIESVEEIVRACDTANIPVFLKDNLKPLLDTLDITGTSFGGLTSLDTSINRQGCRKREWYRLRQETPTIH